MLINQNEWTCVWPNTKSQPWATSTGYPRVFKHWNLPAQHTQNQVENKEGSKDDQADKVDPRQLEAHRIIHLKKTTELDEDKLKQLTDISLLKADKGNIEAFLDQHKIDLGWWCGNRSSADCCSPPVHVWIYLSFFKKSLFWGGTTSHLPPATAQCIQLACSHILLPIGGKASIYCLVFSCSF